MTEYALSFPCQGEHLVGILHKPDQPKRRGVLMVVAGGPQYRVGGHRQLTLWARHMAAEGYPVLRFDNRGAGDSSGAYQGFEHLDDDIRAAVDRFFEEMPELQEIALWGECNAASAILFYAYRDSRVKGAALLNPWVRTEDGEARTILRHYYLQRITQPDFWKKVFSLRFNPLKSARSALELVGKARGPKESPVGTSHATDLQAPLRKDLALPQRMLAGIGRFQGSVMLVLSGRDLVAKEFEELVKGSKAWRDHLDSKHLAWHDLPEGDHTFSSAAQRNQVAAWGLDWLRSW